MKRQLFLLGISFFTILSLDSCTHYYYAPNLHNVPAFKEKNEIRATGGMLLSDEMVGGDIQAAYAMTKESAILASACFINPGAKGRGKGQFYELGSGYYQPISSKNAGVSKKFVFEAYGMFGIGNAKNWYVTASDNGYPNSYVSANFMKCYAQVSISYVTNFIEISFSNKIGLVHSFGIKNHISDSLFNASQSYGPAYDLGILYKNKAAFFYEPAGTLRLGFKYFKLYAQSGFSIMPARFGELNSSITLNMGITIDIGKRFKLANDHPKGQKWKILFD